MTLTETFLKTVAFSISVWVYPREMKTRDGNLKNAAILPRCLYYVNIVVPILYARKISRVLQACTLMYPLCLYRMFI